MTDFASLGLSTELLRAIEEKGYATPSPIQTGAIPVILKGRDLLAAAQTGTGKTAGFTLPAMQRLTRSGRKVRRRGARALVLTPTRELAAQVGDSVKTYGRYLSLYSTVVFGGVGIQPQINSLRRGVDVLVATPGRLLDLCDQDACDLSEVEILILDEADRMLDMGFIHDLKKVVNMLPSKRQNLMFSATFSKEIRELTRQFLVDPEIVEISPEKTTAEKVVQRAVRCDASRKAELTTHLIKEGRWEQVLIFTRTKHGANRLSQRLEKAEIKSSAIHGNKTQGARTRALEAFKNRKIQVLVATDIAARGLDISQLPHVVNYELPNIPEDYVHRIGRTGRAGENGSAISLIANDERPFLKGIERTIGQKIPVEDVVGFEPTLWPDRSPTASEVQKAAEERKKAARKSRGPRKQVSRKSSSRVSGGPSRKRTRRRKFDGRR